VKALPLRKKNGTELRIGLEQRVWHMSVNAFPDLNKVCSRGTCTSEFIIEDKIANFV